MSADLTRRKEPMSNLIREHSEVVRRMEAGAAGAKFIEVEAEPKATIVHRFAVGDKVTDGLIRGTVTQLDPNRPLVGVEFFPWPNERKWDWMSEDRLRRDK